MKHLPLILFFFTSALQAQYFDYSASVNLQGIYSSEKQSPFWLHSNQRGRIDELTTLAAWASASGSYSLNRDTFITLGIGTLYQNGYTDKLELDEGFISLENTRFTAFIGKKQKKEIYSGLSATNQNILWSLNAAPMPGIGFTITKPVMLWERGGLGFKASWEEYITDDDRYVEDARVHHKSLHLVFNKVRNFELVIGVQHFAQWGGISPVYGKLPATIDDYLKVFIGKEGRDDVQGEEANALGNHLGSYEVYLNTSLSNYDIQLLYNTLFEDNSGRVLGNTPDGRYGVYIADKDEEIKWVEAFMYEFYYTRDQSKNTPTEDGNDNYFNNNLYRSGWTYNKRILGLPFILLDEDRFRVEQNSIIAHHLGIKGTAGDIYPYKFLVSYRANYGAKKGSDKPQSQLISTIFDIKLWKEFVDVNLQIGYDVDLEASSNLGAGIRVSKKFF